MPVLFRGAATSSLLLACAVSTSLALAQQAPRNLEPLPDIPPPPKMTNTPGDAVEPQVTIRQEAENKIEEFRVRGRVYAIRVTPRIGKPYLLIDPDGKGTMTKAEDIGGGIKPPQWVLFEF